MPDVAMEWPIGTNLQDIVHATRLGTQICDPRVSMSFYTISEAVGSGCYGRSLVDQLEVFPHPRLSLILYLIHHIFGIPRLLR